MNSLLHLADAALQYYRGKQTGFWGLVGIFLALLIGASWDYIYPLFEKIGLVQFLKNIGLIHDNAPYLSALYIIIAGTLLCFAIAISLIIVMGIGLGLVALLETKKGNYIILAIICVICSPLLLIYGIVKVSRWMNEKIQQKKDPEGYAERKRLEKNKDVIDYLIHVGVEEEKERIKKEREKRYYEALISPILDTPDIDLEEEIVVRDNKLTVEEAYHRLNRLPTEGDYFFLIGVSYERDLYLIIPRPVRPGVLRTPNTFVGEKWFLKVKTEVLNEKPPYQTRLVIDTKNSHFDRDTDWPLFYQSTWFNPSYHNLNEYSIDMFEFFIDPKRCKEIMQVCKGYLHYYHYRYFVECEQKSYFLRKRKLEELISNAKSEEEFNQYVEEIKQFNASNEDVVKLIWENNRHSSNLSKGWLS